MWDGIITCGSFASKPFFKRCSGTEIYLGEGFSWYECERKCSEYSVEHGSGCCEGRAETWGKCAYFAGGYEIEGFYESKSVQCIGKEKFNSCNYFSNFSELYNKLYYMLVQFLSLFLL